MNTTQADKYLHAAGAFVCRVEMPLNGWLAEIGRNNTPCVQIPLIVTEGPMAGKRITYYAWLTPRACDRSCRTLHECFQFNGDFEWLASDPKGFAGHRCHAVTTMGSYNGQRRCSVRWLHPAAPGTGPTSRTGPTSPTSPTVLE